MLAKEVAIVPKLSGLEWEMQSRGCLSLENAVLELQKEGSDTGRMMESHNRQKETINKLADVLEGVRIIPRDSWNGEFAKDYRVVIAPGGDNHLQYVARFIDKQIIVGLNSDPKTSHGVLDTFKPEDIDSLKDAVDRDKFNIEEWARLRVVLNEKYSLPYYAMSEVHIRESDPDGMARDLVTYKGKTQEVRCTGFLICTGAGLTGWYKGVVSNWREELLEGLKDFKRIDQKARFVVRENPDVNTFQVGDLGDESFLINSLEKHGEISFDPMPFEDRFKFKFNRGIKASISVSPEHSLRVAVL